MSCAWEDCFTCPYDDCIASIKTIVGAKKEEPKASKHEEQQMCEHDDCFTCPYEDCIANSVKDMGINRKKRAEKAKKRKKAEKQNTAVEKKRKTENKKEYQKEYQKKYYAERRKEILEKRHQHYIENIDKAKAYSKQYYHTHKIKSAEKAI